MIIMSVDLGKARTGIAVSDATNQFAFPKEVITEYNSEKLVNKVCFAAEKYSAELIVVGLPKNMDGTEGERSEVVRAFAKLLSEYTDIPLDFYDERMTTMVAYRFLGETGTYGKKRKSCVDTLSAQIILQNYLDRERSQKN